MENFEGILGAVTAGVLKAGLRPTTSLQLCVGLFFPPETRSRNLTTRKVDRRCRTDFAGGLPGTRVVPYPVSPFAKECMYLTRSSLSGSKSFSVSNPSGARRAVDNSRARGSIQECNWAGPTHVASFHFARADDNEPAR